MFTQLINSGNVDYFSNKTALHVVTGVNNENNISISEFGGADGLTDGAGLLMPTWAYWSIAAYLLFISVVGLTMNIIVAIVILNDPRKMTPLNWMLLNLACSDGVIAGFGTPFSTAAALQFRWPFSHNMCVAYAMIMSTAGIGSITTLTVLAVWRYQLVVCCPAKRKTTFTNHSGRLDCRHGVLLLTLIWIYALMVTCPPLLGWGRYGREPAQISCSVNWESKKHHNRSYIFYMFVMGLVIPLVLIVASYIKILHGLRQRRRQAEIRGETPKTLQPSDGSGHSAQCHSQMLVARQQSITNKRKQQPINNDPPHYHYRGDAAEKRVTMMVACMIAAFMSAWAPYSILALFETFYSVGSNENDSKNKANFSSVAEDDDLIDVGIISPAFTAIPSLFAKTSAVLNPFIYGLLNTQFRLAWERFSLRFFSRRQQRCDPTEVIASRKKQIKKPNVWQFRLTSNSDPLPTVHLPMRKIKFANEVKRGHARSTATKITKVLPSTDTQTSCSTPMSNGNKNQEELKQSKHTLREQENMIEYQSVRLSSSFSTSLPLLLACTLSHLVCQEVEVTCQPIKKSSIEYPTKEEHPRYSTPVHLLSQTVD